jgi:hypothetical protein
MPSVGTGFPAGIRTKKVVEEITAARTLTADDFDKVFIIQTADLTVTLPAVTPAMLGAGFTFILSAAALSAGTGFSIAPAAVDAIASQGLTSVDNQVLRSAGATDTEGDCAELISDGGAVGEQGWYALLQRGTWTKV